MSAYSRTHLSDSDLWRIADQRVAQRRQSSAHQLADLAEIDARQLYRERGYSSLHAFCVEHWHFSDDSAYKRIQAARAARQFPVLFLEVQQARLHLTAVRLLAPHLTPDNVSELIAASVHKRSVDIEQFLAQRFPLSKSPAPATKIQAIPSRPVGLAPGQVETPSLLQPSEPSPSQPSLPVPPPPQRFLIQVAVDKETHDLLRHVQTLLGHAVPSGDVAEVLHRALAAYAVQLEKRKFGAGKKAKKRSTGGRKTPADVKHAVWERDGGCCTFVSSDGHRCGSRELIEFDHVDPVALGGKSTVERVRLRCRPHNQLEAERVFGSGFMAQKRASRRARPSPSPLRRLPDPRPPACSSRDAGTPARAP